MTELNIKIGVPHFKSAVKKYRNSGYTLEKAINEFIDNIIKKCNKIYLTTEIDDCGNLQQLKISDNYEHGFENILKEGIHNPFNMGHDNIIHNNDNETSEFGIGLKAGAIAISNQLDVFTKVPYLQGNYHVYANFLEMEKEPDPILSYEVITKTITDREFNGNPIKSHPFPFGSSIILSKIRDTIYHKTTEEKLTNFLIKKIGKTYSRFLDKCEIKVNGKSVIVPYDFFNDKKCIPFTIKSSIYIKNNNNQHDFYCKKETYDNTCYSKYNNDTNRWNKLTDNKYISYFDKNKPSIQLRTTFALYSDKFHNNEENELPQDILNIYS
jgi:hypothetical protein